jgi:hypothetical protein
MDVDKYSEDELEDIVAALTYVRNDISEYAIQLTDNKRSGTLFQPFSEPAISNLGSLACLPVELLLSICMMLDVSSAIQFSHVSRQARHLIASRKQYRLVGQHGIECLFVLLKSGLARRTYISDLFSALTARRCSKCEHFGSLIFLPFAERCCFGCIQYNVYFRVILMRTLSIKSHISATTLRGRVPYMTTLGGKYAMKGVAKMRSQTIVAWRDCEHLVGDKTIRNEFNWRSLQFASVVSLPYVDPKTEEAQSGVSCVGCRHPGLEGYKRYQLYLSEDVVGHLRECKDAQYTWEHTRKTLSNPQ